MVVRGILAACCGCWLFASAAVAQTPAPPAPAEATSILLMTRDTQVAADGTSVQTLHIEVRANNDAGVTALGQIAFTYDTQTQKADVTEALNRKPDGSTVPVAASAIYEQPPAAVAGIVTSLRSKIILFPQLRVGDTIVYTIKLNDQPVFPGQFIQAEVFDPTTAYGEVRETVTAPKSLALAVENHQVEFSKKDVGADTLYSWHYAAPQPAEAKPSSGISLLARMPRFFISSEKDYAALGRAYATAQQDKRKPTAQVTALADKITAGTSDRRQQAEKIYDWVSSNIRYVAIELGTGSFIPHDADSIIANGYGDCKDHDLLLGALLKAKGIDSTPVLINGGTEYALSDIPTYTGIDHVITYVPEFSTYLDSTAALAPFGVLPLVEYGKPIILASPNGAALGQVPVLAPGVAKIGVVARSVMDKDGIVTTTSTTSASGPYAITLRTIGLGIQALGPTAAKKLLTAQGDADAEGSFTQDSPVALTPSFAITGTMKTSSLKDNLVGDKRFRMPAGMRLLDASGDGIMGPFDRGGLPDSDATLCFSAEATQDLSLKAPPGLVYAAPPEDVQIQTPELTYTAQWTVDGDTMRVQRRFVSKINAPLCGGDVGVRTAAAMKRIADSFDKATFFFMTGDQGKTEALYQSGRKHLGAGEYVDAIADYDKALAQMPLSQQSNILFARSIAEKNLRQYDDAIADIGKAMSLGPGSSDLYFGRGQIFQAMGQGQNAVDDFTKAIALDAYNTQAYGGRGAIYSQMHKYQLAKEDFDKAIALDPAVELYYEARATSFIGLLQFDLALADFDRALALTPKNSRVFEGRSFAHQGLHQYEAAIQDMDQAIAINPGSARLWLRRGILKNQARKSGAGTADINQAQKLDPKILQ